MQFDPQSRVIKIIRELCETTLDGPRSNPFFDSVLKNPENYVFMTSQRSETRAYGSQTIPHIGAVVDAQTNAFFDSMDSEFRTQYPELGSDAPAGIIDYVRGISQPDACGNVTIIVDRYMIIKKTGEFPDIKIKEYIRPAGGHDINSLHELRRNDDYKTGWMRGFYDTLSDHRNPAPQDAFRRISEGDAFLAGYIEGIRVRRAKPFQ